MWALGGPAGAEVSRAIFPRIGRPGDLRPPATTSRIRKFGDNSHGGRTSSRLHVSRRRLRISAENSAGKSRAGMNGVSAKNMVRNAGAQTGEPGSRSHWATCSEIGPSQAGRRVYDFAQESSGNPEIRDSGFRRQFVQGTNNFSSLSAVYYRISGRDVVPPWPDWPAREVG